MKRIKMISRIFVFVLLSSIFISGNLYSQNIEKNIGLQMYSLRDDVGQNSKNVDAVIKEIGEMGYKYVETANYDNGLIYGMEPEVFKAKLKAAGIYAVSTHTGRGLADKPKDTNWEEIWAWWDKCIASHKAAGMKYVVTPGMPTPETLEDLQVYCDYYNKIGEKCKAAGMKFGYHNHAFEFEKIYKTKEGNSISMYDYMVQNTDPNKVFFELDVYWSEKGKRPAPELFEQYKGRFEVLHIKDEKELGKSGYIDFKAIFDNIKKAGTKYLIVEVEEYNMPPVESVKESLDYLNKSSFVKKDYSK